MIRPFTIITLGLACASGLYLYQSKHQAQMLDREIARTIKQTEAARERIGMLRTEWALVNEPDRLAELARAHTALQTLKPTQFVAMADLASHLPPPGLKPQEPEPEEPALPFLQASPAPVLPPVAAPIQSAAVSAPAPVASSAPAMVAEQRAPVIAEPRPAAPRKPVKPADPVVAATTPVVAAATPVVAATTPVRPAPIEPMPAPTPVHVASRPAPRPFAPPVVDADATAPGTIGAAVLRAMRAQNSAPMPVHAAAPAYAPPAQAYAPAAQPYAPAVQTYAPAPQPYAPAYAQPAASFLGNSRGSLPPPVPYAAR